MSQVLKIASIVSFSSSEKLNMLKCTNFTKFWDCQVPHWIELGHYYYCITGLHVAKYKVILHDNYYQLAISSHHLPLKHVVFGLFVQQIDELQVIVGFVKAAKRLKNVCK